MVETRKGRGSRREGGGVREVERGERRSGEGEVGGSRGWGGKRAGGGEGGIERGRINRPGGVFVRGVSARGVRGKGGGRG